MFPLLLAAGAGVNAIGKLMAGASSSAMDRIQEQAAGTNTDLLNKQADIAHMGVDFAASKERDTLGKIEEAGRQTLSAQRTYFAVNNLDPTFGSPLLVQAMTAGRVATDRDLAETSFAIDKANALSNEAQLRGRAAGSAAQELAYSIKGSTDLTAGFFGAATSFLSAGAALSGGGFSMPKLNLSSLGFNPIGGASGQ